MSRRDPSVWLRIPEGLIGEIAALARHNKLSVGEQIVSILMQAMRMQSMAEQIVRMERQVKRLKEQKANHAAQGRGDVDAPP